MWIQQIWVFCGFVVDQCCVCCCVCFGDVVYDVGDVFRDDFVVGDVVGYEQWFCVYYYDVVDDYVDQVLFDCVVFVDCLCDCDFCVDVVGVGCQQWVVEVVQCVGVEQFGEIVDVVEDFRVVCCLYG